MPWGQNQPSTDFRKNKKDTAILPGPAWFHKKVQHPRIENKPLIFNWTDLKVPNPPHNILLSAPKIWDLNSLKQ